MTLPLAIKRRLTLIGEQADAAIDLADAALVLSMVGERGVDQTAHRRHLRDLAGRVTELAAADPFVVATLPGRAQVLTQTIFDDFGYEGEEDDGTVPSPTLAATIERRAGLPTALGILYLHAARAQGWQAEALSFPAPFLIRLSLGGARIILHPFAQGAVIVPQDMRVFLKALTGPEAELAPHHYRPLTNREVLLRMQNHTKLRHLHDGDMHAVLLAVEASMAVAPERADLLQEAGLAHAHLGQTAEAIAALETYLITAPASADRNRTVQLLGRLRRQAGT